MKHNRPNAKRPTTEGKETMRNTRKRTLTLAAAAVLAFAALSPAAEAAEWSAFLSWYDTTALEDTFGGSFRGSFPINEAWEFDATISYYEDFEDAIPGASKVEIGTIPFDFGFTWTHSPEGGFYTGAGLTWAFMDTGGLEIGGVDIPDPGEADDEFGAYGKLGYRAQNGFLFEVLYRFLDVSIESLQFPPGTVFIGPPPTRFDIDMDGYVVNIGFRF